MSSPKVFFLYEFMRNNKISYHTVYITLYFCMKNPTACMLRVTPTILMLPVPLSFCVQTDVMTFVWVLNVPMDRTAIYDWQVTKRTMLEENRGCGSSFFPWPQYSLWHHSLQTITCLQLCQMVCVITVHVSPDFIMW